jgi:transcription elongation GreA/GreB family factor
MNTIEEKLALKKKLFTHIKEAQQNIINTAKNAMDAAQESAKEDEGSKEEFSESFREQMMIDRDMFARKFDEAASLMEIIHKLEYHKTYDEVRFGSMVITANAKYFISISLGQVMIDNETIFCISNLSPIYQELQGKKKGDFFEFRGQKTEIKEVY